MQAVQSQCQQCKTCHSHASVLIIACVASDALRGLASFLYSSDRAVLQLLHVLDWQPVLQQIAPVTTQLQASDTPTSQASLMDADSQNIPAPSEESASSQKGKQLQTARSMDVVSKAWAANLMLLVLPTCVMMTNADLPAWLQQLVGSHDSQPPSPDAGEKHAQTFGLYVFGTAWFVHLDYNMFRTHK